MRLVLASANTSRAQILRDANVPFKVSPAHVDEDAVKTSCGIALRCLQARGS